MESNAADFVHSEEMADFGGTVTLHRDSDGSIAGDQRHDAPAGRLPGRSRRRVRRHQLARIDRLEPGATEALKFESDDRRESGRGRPIVPKVRTPPAN